MRAVRRSVGTRGTGWRARRRRAEMTTSLSDTRGTLCTWDIRLQRRRWQLRLDDDLHAPPPRHDEIASVRPTDYITTIIATDDENVGHFPSPAHLPRPEHHLTLTLSLTRCRPGGGGTICRYGHADRWVRLAARCFLLVLYIVTTARGMGQTDRRTGGWRHWLVIPRGRRHNNLSLPPIH